MFSKRSAIRIALIQVGVVLAGILAASVGDHAARGRVGFVPDSTAFLARFGFLLIALPLAWLMTVLRLRKNAAWAAWAHVQKILALGSGIALIVGLTLFSAYAAGKPWVSSSQWLQRG